MVKQKKSKNYNVTAVSMRGSYAAVSDVCHVVRAASIARPETKLTNLTKPNKYNNTAHTSNPPPVHPESNEITLLEIV